MRFILEAPKSVLTGRTLVGRMVLSLYANQRQEGKKLAKVHTTH